MTHIPIEQVDFGGGPDQVVEQLMHGCDIGHLFVKYGLEFPDAPGTVKLHRVYDWRNGDSPPGDDPVQWGLYLLYLLRTYQGNGEFCSCLEDAAPYAVREKFLRMYIIVVYGGFFLHPDFQHISDPDLFLKSRARVEFTNEGMRLFETIGHTYCNYPHDNPRSYMNACDIPERRYLPKWDCTTETVYEPDEYFARFGQSDRENRPVAAPPRVEARVVIARGTAVAPVPGTAPQPDWCPGCPPVEEVEATYVERTADVALWEKARKEEAQGRQGSVSAESRTGKQGLPADNDRIPLGSGVTMGIIGQGGSGMIVKIWNRQLQVFRAVKLLLDMSNEQLTADQIARSRDRFIREGRMLARLQHPSITSVHDYGEWNGYDFLEMEYVDGPSLDRIVRRSGQMPDMITAAMALQIADALHYAHTETFVVDSDTHTGVIHRDLKPANIMLNPRGRSKVLDFGISRIATMNTMTSGTNFLGTVGYASPEQVEGLPLDIRTDMYSFGLILYEMKTGRPAFPQKDLRSLLNARLSNSYRPIDDYRLKINRELRHVIKKCLQADPDKRFESFFEIRQHLHEGYGALTKEVPDSVLRDFLEKNKAGDFRPHYTPGKQPLFKRFFGNMGRLGADG